MGEVGLASPLPSDDSRGLADPGACRQAPFLELAADAGDEGYLLPVGRAEEDRYRACLAAELVDALPHRRDVGAAGVDDDDPGIADGRGRGEKIIDGERGRGGDGLGLLEILDLLGEGSQPRRKLRRRDAEGAGCLGERRFGMAEAFEGLEPRDRADAAGAGGDALLAGDSHLADLAAVADVRAAAELTAHFTKRHHPDDVGVFLAEEHHRPLMAGVGERQEPRTDRDGGEDVAVDHRLDQVERFAADGASVREVEAKHVGIDLRALLDGVAAEVVLEGGVNQMRGGVRPADRRAAVFIDVR